MRFPKPRRDAPILGDLELEVLREIWDASDGTDARAVHAALASRGISLSTIQATLERLHRKQVLQRDKLGRAFLYRAAVSREQLIGSLIRQVAQSLAEGRMEPVISGFVDLVTETDPLLLDDLATALDAARRKEEP